MTPTEILENRIKLIEKDTSNYFIQSEQQKLGIKFIYYISIFFLIFGIIIALLSTMNISTFSEKWMNSGLFYLCTLVFLLNIYESMKYMTLKKHKVYIKQVLNRVKAYKTPLPNSINSDLERKIKSKTLFVMRIIMSFLALFGCVCYFEKFEIWHKFDIIIFLIWSIYGLLCFYKIQKIKQSISTFKIKFKNSEV